MLDFSLSEADMAIVKNIVKEEVAPILSAVERFSATPSDELMNVRDACKFLKISKTCFYSLLKEKKLPRPVGGEGKLQRWSKNEILSAWGNMK